MMDVRLSHTEQDMKTFVLVALLAAAVSCGKDEGSGTDVGLLDSGIAEDASSATDSGDTAEDMAGRSDIGTGDDMSSPADMGTDGEDMSVSDAAADVAAGPCAAGYTAHEEVEGAVVACEGEADALNQCDAEDACGDGWHLCTATEYRTHFQASEPTSVADATYWLASCVRDGADPTAPSDMVCSDCTGTQTGADAEVSFSCVNALTIETDQLYVGLRAGSACTFAGVDEAGNDAFWNAQPSNALQAGAFCCID
jgi:hypothetical protein